MFVCVEGEMPLCLRVLYCSARDVLRVCLESHNLIWNPLTSPPCVWIVGNVALLDTYTI